MNADNLGKIITFLRKQNNWTQKELANKLGISDKTVSKWETGSGLPEISFLPDLADVFNVTVVHSFAHTQQLDQLLQQKKNLQASQLHS